MSSLPNLTNYDTILNVISYWTNRENINLRVADITLQKNTAVIIYKVFKVKGKPKYNFFFKNGVKIKSNFFWLNNSFTKICKNFQAIANLTWAFNNMKGIFSKPILILRYHK